MTNHFGLKYQLDGKRFGSWLAINESSERDRGYIMWLCRCDCGAEQLVKSSELVYGLSVSCGCKGLNRKSGYPWHNRYKPYNITEEEFNSILSQQNYLCAICLSKFDMDDPTNMHLDHDHITGQVRGILCPMCNQALGLLKDNLERIARAYWYLSQFNSKKECAN